MILSLRIYSFNGRKYTFMSFAVLSPETLDVIKANLYVSLSSNQMAAEERSTMGTASSAELQTH